MPLLTSRVRILLEGIMPERALLRLKRAKIDVYNVKKVGKNQILLSVKPKDCEKVFAFYPNVCYNKNGYSAYVAQKVGLEGAIKYVNLAKKRVGLLLGSLLGLIILLYANTFTFGVEFVGTDVYARECRIALEKGGIKPFAPYKKDKEDWICSQLLKLSGVEYCSIKKIGLYTRVEMRMSPFLEARVEKESMLAKHTGVLRSLTVLKGTPFKKVGEEVGVGDLLVENVFYTQAGEQVCVEPIAKAVIECVFEQEIEAENAEIAFAKGYLSLGLSEKDEIKSKEIIQSPETERLFYVKIGYTVIETVNL